MWCETWQRLQAAEEPAPFVTAQFAMRNLPDNGPRFDRRQMVRRKRYEQIEAKSDADIKTKEAGLGTKSPHSSLPFSAQ